MIRPSGISGIIERIRDLGRVKLALLGAGLVSLLLIVVVLGVSMGGGDSAASDGADGADSDLVVNFDDEPLAEEPLPTEPLLMTVEEQVAATVAAMAPVPTPTIEVTPDIGATLQAEMAVRRAGSSTAQLSNPLDAGVMRNPQLSEADKHYFESLGKDLWVATQIYMRLTEVSSRDFQGWTESYVGERLLFIDGLTGALSEELPEADKAGVSDVVASYSDYIDSGIRSVQAGVAEARAAHSIFQAGEAESVDELDALDRELLRQHYLNLTGLMTEFYAVMSSYGCSACGELFRSPFVLE